ncbi:MAG: hypothetical protein M3N95_16720 [Actinomycetota bacterium]|nr:hypothetical protein [Actinomycetota bacterium]
MALTVESVPDSAAFGKERRVGVDHFVVDADRPRAVENRTKFGEPPLTPTIGHRAGKGLGAGLEGDQHVPAGQ